MSISPEALACGSDASREDDGLESEQERFPTSAAPATESQYTEATQTPQWSWLPPLHRLRPKGPQGDPHGEPKRRVTADPFDPNPRKRPRNRYTKEQKELVIRAGETSSKDALRVGILFGMPPATVRNLLFHARRVEAGQEPRAAAAAALGKKKRATPRHFFPEDEEVLGELVHEHCTMTVGQLTLHVNLEKLRRIMISLERQLPEGEQLRDEEKVFLGPLDRDKCLSNPTVKQLYDKTHLQGSRSVYRAMKRNIFSLRRAVPDQTAMNSELNMAKRLHVAKKLHSLLVDDNTHVVYVDTVPFCFAARRSCVWAPRGLRAVHGMLPAAGTASGSTQVAMAVSPTHGILCSKVYSPELKRAGGEGGGRQPRAAPKTSHAQEHLYSFLDDVLRALWHERCSLQLDGARVVFFTGGVPEHGRQLGAAAGLQMLQACESFQLWSEWIEHGRCTMALKFLSPESPTLNLTEFYCGLLRSQANQLRKGPAFARKLDTTGVSWEQAQSMRLRVLSDILTQAVADLQHNVLKQASETHLLKEEVLRVIERDGFLDLHWRPVQLKNNKAHTAHTGSDHSHDSDDSDDSDEDNGVGNSGAAATDDCDDDDDDDDDDEEQEGQEEGEAV